MTGTTTGVGTVASVKATTSPSSPSVKQPSSAAASSFLTLHHQKVLQDIKQRCLEKDRYIAKLEHLLQEHDIHLPIEENDPETSAAVSPTLRQSLEEETTFVLTSGNIQELQLFIQKHKSLVRKLHYRIEYYDLTFQTKVFNTLQHQIFSISTIVTQLCCFWRSQETHQADILSHITGRILPGHMTLIIGPPGSGKSGKKYFSTFENPS